MRKRRSARLALTVATAVVAVAAVLQGGSASAAAPVSASTQAKGQTQAKPAAGGADRASGEPRPLRQDQASRVLSPDQVLPKSWKTSADRAVTVAGDGSGLHLLAADSGSAYQWRTVATLGEPGFGTDLWIGNACVTSSGKRAVVVYAPREFTNDPALMERGAFAAVVDLATGKVTKLADEVTLGYFNPGCGVGETAVLTQLGDDKHNTTRLLIVDAVTGKVTRRQSEPVEVTSAVPDGDTVVGAAAGRLVRFDRRNHASALAITSGPAYQLRADGSGGIVFLDWSHGTERARRVAGGRTTMFAQGPSGSLGLQSGTGGKVFLTGHPMSTTRLPATVTRVDVAPTATVSSTGALAIDHAVPASLRSHVNNPLAATAWNAAAPLQIAAEVPSTGKKISFTAGQDAAAAKGAGRNPSPALRGSTTSAVSAKAHSASAASASPGSSAGPAITPMAGSPTSPVDDDRTCSMPRNDANQQAYQPTPNQVEWAADMAIRGDLTSAYVRQGGWRTADGLGTVNPQGMFPLPGLTGTSTGRIPAQVLLGVLAQESNLWQAEGGALPGQTSSTLASINGFYGHPSDPATPEDYWQINWDKTDCGYGIGQQTDGMKIGEVNELPAAQQKAIALDYTSNIAVAARTLEVKWNELHVTAVQPNTITINNDDPTAPENWFAALWDYNSGLNYYNPADPSAPWGLGYLNNPDNPLYSPGRSAFLDNNSYADAAHPQDWSYEEKVLGWGAWPIDTGRAYADDGTFNHSNPAGYSAAWWNSSQDRSQVKPLSGTFCKPTVNDCDPLNPPRCEVDHLGPSCDPPHWFNQPTGWKPDCASTCGHEYLTYQTLKTELGNGNNGSGHMCDDSAPSGALIVDDVASSVPTMTDGCGKSSWTNSGTFGFTFDSDIAGHYEAKGDLHQIGGGFGDHFWYAHTRDSTHLVDALNDPRDTTDISSTKDLGVSGDMAVTGRWTLGQSVNAWTRVLVHLPDTGSATQQATYSIHTGDTTTQENRILNVRSQSNQWVSLGVFPFSSGHGDFQGVELTNYTADGTGDNDVAWDAMAFQPLSAKPHDFVVQLGDSYSSGEGAEPYQYGTDVDYGTPDWNACRRSQNSWYRLAVLPDASSTIGQQVDSLNPNTDAHQLACSGGYTYTVDSGTGFHPVPQWGSLGEFGEVDQVHAGFLDTNTTLVALTIGGNDADFSGTLQSCVTLGCPSDSTVQPKLAAAATQMATVVKDIRKQAPHAKIIVMGYPRLFQAGAPTCTVAVGEQTQQINGWADYFTSHMASAVAGLNDANAVFFSPDDRFEGDRICDSGNGINGLVAAQTGPGDFPCQVTSACVSMESYHPNNAGTVRYALAFDDAMAAANYS